MKIGEARRLIYGERVLCPADRGKPAFVGTVRSNDCDTIGAGQTIYGEHYIWVSVQDERHLHTVWPSNRLERV